MHRLPRPSSRRLRRVCFLRLGVVVAAPAWLVCASLQIGCAARAKHAEAPRDSSEEASPDGVACLAAGPEHCYDAVDNNCNGLIDEGCGTPSGLVHIAISWREPEVDVDLEVISPDGTLVEVEKTLDNGLTKLRDCPGEENACRGVNTEHVVLQPEHAVPIGTYLVRVRLEDSAGAEPPIEVSVAARLGPKSYATRLELAAEKDARELSWEL